MPLLLQHNAAPIDAFSFPNLEPAPFLFQFEIKKQRGHLIEDAGVHLIYGLLNSTSAAHTRNRAGCSPGEEDITVAPFSSADCKIWNEDPSLTSI